MGEDFPDDGTTESGSRQLGRLERVYYVVGGLASFAAGATVALLAPGDVHDSMDARGFITAAFGITGVVLSASAIRGQTFETPPTEDLE